MKLRPAFLKSTISAQMHLLGLIALIVASVDLLARASQSTTAAYLACLVFVVTGCMVFFSSTLYHFVCDGCEASERSLIWLKQLDHSSIYLFIAGTYTPTLYLIVQEPWRTTLLVVTWTLAVLGLLYTAFKARLPRVLQSRAVYTGIFVLMGWVILVRITEVVRALDALELVFFFGGGLAYTLGSLIYVFKKPNFIMDVFGFHEIWHIMVLLGAAMHFLFVHRLIVTAT